MHKRNCLFTGILLLLIISIPRSVFAASGGLLVHFLYVGQGDAILIQCENEAMMIDFGDETQGRFLRKYLKKQKITTLKYAVGTHPHDDHIGGMDDVLKSVKTENVFMPAVSANTQAYRSVVSVCRRRGYTILHPRASKKRQYKLGSASFRIFAPNSRRYKNDNNYSYVIKLTYGKTRFLFTGDASFRSEEEMLQKKYNLRSDVLKVGHHGCRTSSEPFLEKVRPKYAVISCGINNPNRHPRPPVLRRLVNQQTKIFRTDKQGTIIAASDGQRIAWSTEMDD